jgi:transposase
MAKKVVQEIRRATRRQFTSEEKIRIVLEGLRGEISVAELCRREGIAPTGCYRCSKDFLEAGKNGLVRDTRRDATADGVWDPKAENEILRAELPKRVTVTPMERHHDPRVLYPKSVWPDAPASGTRLQDQALEAFWHVLVYTLLPHSGQ